jgi:hypothetical protein
LAWKKPAVAIEWNEEAYMDSASAVGVKAASHSGTVAGNVYADLSRCSGGSHIYCSLLFFLFF